MKFRVVKHYQELIMVIVQSMSIKDWSIPAILGRLYYQKKNKWFFLADEKFESHRSLFTKIKVQLDKSRTPSVKIKLPEERTKKK
jgi:hypothetical protein